MPNPYSVDLRWRAVWLAVIRGMNCAEIASTLFMSEKSVHRYISLFQTTGYVDPKKHASGPERILTDFEQCTVLQTLIHRPTSYIYEVQRDLFEVTGVWVSESTICRTASSKAARFYVQKSRVYCFTAQ